MSKIALEGNSLGSGTFTIAAPNSNSNPTLTLPTSSGTVVVTGGAQTIEFAAGSAASPSITFTGDTNTGIFSPAADTIAFAEGGAEAMRIDSSGRLIIASSAAETTISGSAPVFQVTGSGFNSIGSFTRRENNANGPAFCFAKSRNTSANSYTVVQNGDSLGAIIFIGDDGTDLDTYGAVISAQVDGTPGANDMPGRLTFSTTADGASSPTERMRIDSSGNVLVGDTSADYSVAGRGNIEINGSSNSILALKIGGTPASYFYASGTDLSIVNERNGLITLSTNNLERVRISSGGDFYIGSTGPAAGANRLHVKSSGTYACLIEQAGSDQSGNYPLTVLNGGTSGNNLFVAFSTDGAPGSDTLRGNIDFNRTAGQVRYNTTSDATLKNIIGDADGQRSLEILNTTRLREFAWKNDLEQNKQIGVIAQELHQTFAGAVSVGGDVEKPDGKGGLITEYRPWSVDKTAFTFHLIAGWQAHEKLLKEAMTRIEALEAEVAALKGQ